jgi:hypothetical protein
MIVTKDLLHHKKNTPQKLYNKLKKLEDLLPDIQYKLQKIMVEADLSENLKDIHEELYKCHIGCCFILEYLQKEMRKK